MNADQNQRQNPNPEPPRRQEKQEQNISTAETRREAKSIKAARSGNLSVSPWFSLVFDLVHMSWRSWRLGGSL
jgi:hypothetical protein